MENVESIEQTERESPAIYQRKSRWDVLCPRCGRFSEHGSTSCEHCSAQLFNPLFVLNDALNHVSFGTLVKFSFKLIAAGIAAAIPFALVGAVLGAIASNPR